METASACVPTNATEVIASIEKVFAAVMVRPLYLAQQENDQSDDENNAKAFLPDVHGDLL